MNYSVGLIRSFVASLLLACVCVMLPAPTVQAQGIKIRSIEIQYTGPETISRERILAQMRTAVGQVYSDSIAEQDIRNLYATGQIQNVRIFGQQQGEGVKVIVAVPLPPE